MKPQTLLWELRSSKILLYLAVASSCLVSRGGGQEETKSLKVVWGGSVQRYDWSPDIDGDGHWDLIIGDSGFPALTKFGRAYVLSGQSGSKVYEYIGAMAGDSLGSSVAALGRVDADATPDFGGTGRESFVWSGADGSELYSEILQRGHGVAPLGDLNADGFHDFALMLNVPFVGFEVRVVYGGSFVSPYTIQAPSPSWKTFGLAIEAMDDVNDDGVPDIAAGAPGLGPPLDCSLGYVGVFSGSDGQLIYSREGEGQGSEFGASLASPGDLNGDGVGDLVVGSPSCCASCFSASGKGRVYFLDGRTGETIDEVQPARGKTKFGRIVSAAGDANGNGVPDVIIEASPGTMYLLEGATRETIYSLPYDPTKVTLNPLGVEDLDGDDFPDFFSQYQNAVGDFIGLYSGAPIGVDTFGVACGTGGELPRIGATGSPKIGADYDINLSNVAPGLTAFLAIGLSNTTWMGLPLPFDLGVIGMAGCDLSVSLDAIFTAQTRRVTPGLGAATVTNAIPNDPALLGSTVYAQWFVLNPPGGPTLGATTRGLAITLQ